MHEAWQIYLYTYVRMFETIMLNRDVLSLEIVYQADVYSEDPVYVSSDYCEAAYPRWTLWRCGYLGRGNSQVVSACAVWAVWDKYPSPNVIYLGFKEY